MLQYFVRYCIFTVPSLLVFTAYFQLFITNLQFFSLMKLPIYAFFVLLCLSNQVIFAQNTSRITVEDIWKNYTFYAKNVPGFNFLKDGKSYTTSDETTILRNDLRTGEVTETILDLNTLGQNEKNTVRKFDDFDFSADEQKILLRVANEQIYRRSSKALNFVWDMKGKTMTPVFDKGRQSNVTFNPKGNRLAFTMENNLYVRDLETNEVKQVTTDGAQNKIINGFCDWVYEEEFEFTRAFEWSEDGTKIGFLRFDEGDVPEFTMQIYRDAAYPKAQTFKYPKVGEPNSKVTVWIYDLQSQALTQVQTDETTPDVYFPRLRWTADGELCVLRMNRHQNELDLLLASPKTGKTRLLLHETNKAYIEITDDFKFLADGKHFLWMSEQNGFNHLYLYDMKGKMQQQLTKGNWDVLKCYGIDEANKRLYYQAAKSSPTQKAIYCVQLDGKNDKALFDQNATNDADFSPTFEYAVLTQSNANTPPVYSIFNATNGKIVRTLEDNARVQTLQKQYGAAKVEFFQFTHRDESDAPVTLNGYWIKPNDFDPKKKYPIFMTQYSGPNSQKATNSWIGQDYWWYQLLVQQGYIVVCVDGRGTGARGEAFRKITYKQLGHYEVIDQIAAAKWLAQQPFVDGSRIGIFGWSYGGYMSSLCITKGADVFKTAIAVAPVTNWKWYDSIYTERYMQSDKDNPKGYADNSPVYFADRLKGNFLLIHGMADDNVHFQNSVELVNALIKANKQFDVAYYPNRNHGIYGGDTRLHLYTKMTKFLLEKL
jgi:dipeptidyl-peptidase 4